MIVRKCAGSIAQAKLQCNVGQSVADFCEHCDTDGCNGAAQYGPMAAIIAIPAIVIMKAFSFWVYSSAIEYQ